MQVWKMYCWVAESEISVMEGETYMKSICSWFAINIFTEPTGVVPHLTLPSWFANAGKDNIYLAYTMNDLNKKCGKWF